MVSKLQNRENSSKKEVYEISVDDLQNPQKKQHEIIKENKNIFNLKIILTVVLGGVAITGVSQIRPEFAEGTYNKVATRYYNATGENIESQVLKLMEHTRRAWGTDLPLRVIVQQWEIVPFDDSNITVAGDMDQTMNNWDNYITNNSNIDKNVIHVLQANNVDADFGTIHARTRFITFDNNNLENNLAIVVHSKYTIDGNNGFHYHTHEGAGHGNHLFTQPNITRYSNFYESDITNYEDQDQNQSTNKIKSIQDHLQNPAKKESTGMQKIKNVLKEFLEKALPESLLKIIRGAKDDIDEHPFGKVVNLEANLGTPDAPLWTAFTYRTTMASGMMPCDGGYAPLITTSNPVVESDGYVYSIKIEGDETFQIRVNPDELKNYHNGENFNTGDNVKEFLTNIDPDRITTTPVPEWELPVAPQIEMNGTIAKIANPEDYNVVRNNLPVEYRWYVYHKDNTANGAFLNPTEAGYKLTQEVDLSQFFGTHNGFTINSTADMRVRVFAVHQNALSSENVLPNQLPEAPTNVDVSVTTNSAHATWPSATDPDGTVENYKVELWKDNQLVVSDEVSQTFCDFTDLNENQTYLMKVWSIDNTGAYSENFAEKTFTTLETVNEPPTTPPNFEASNPTQTTVDLSWGNSVDNKNVVGYYVKVLLGNTEVANYETTANSMTVGNLEPGRYYTFEIRAKDDEGAYSTPAITHETTLFYPDTTPPNPVNENTFNVLTDEDHLTFTLNQEVTDNYENSATDSISGVNSVLFFVDGQYYGELTDPQLGDSFTISDLNPDKSYEITEIVTDNNGNESAPFVKSYTTDDIGNHDLGKLNNLKFYPNPVKDFVNFEVPLDLEIKNLVVFDLMGRENIVILNNYENTIENGVQKIRIDLSKLEKDNLYILDVQTDKGFYSRKFIKE